jgi:enoyl-CoA hydratase
MPFENIIYKKEAGLGTVIFNRPDKFNALNRNVFQELQIVFQEADKDPDVRVLILTGQGDHFGAGADIQMISDLKSSAECYRFTGENQTYHLLDNFAKPTVAAIKGFCLGGMLELALCCDFRIAAENVKFGLPEVKLGLLPGGGGTQRLPRLIGMTKAKELIYLGDFIDGQEAYRLGLVNMLVLRDHLEAKTEQLAERLASRPSFALRVIKDVMQAGINVGLQEALEIERQGFALLFSTADKEEGTAAFIEKRKPIFSGR